jgi:hypothetical protein
MYIMKRESDLKAEVRHRTFPPYAEPECILIAFKTLFIFMDKIPIHTSHLFLPVCVEFRLRAELQVPTFRLLRLHALRVAALICIRMSNNFGGRMNVFVVMVIVRHILEIFCQ